MKMIIRGMHQRNVALLENNLVDCIVVIEYGKLQKVKFENIVLTNGHSLKSKTDFQTERFSQYGDSHFPQEANYSIIYNSEHGKELVFFKLSEWEIFKINWIQKKFWIQDTNNWIKFIIPVITGVIVYSITRKIYGC